MRGAERREPFRIWYLSNKLILCGEPIFTPAGLRGRVNNGGRTKESMVYIIVFIALLALSFLFTSGLVWLVCWAFSFTFTWKLAVGVYAVIALLGGVFKNTSK